MKSITLARNAMNIIVNNVPAQTLSRTTYCALVVKLSSGERAVFVAEDGASAAGIGNQNLLNALETHLNVAIIPCASPIAGQGTWHMNDAEQQALRTFTDARNNNGALNGAVLKAVVANRNICPSCTYTLTQLGLNVNGTEATAP